MEYILLICFTVSFFTTYFMTPLWIRASKRAGLIGKDMNKLKDLEAAEVGGITVAAGFMGGVLCYIGLSTFYFHTEAQLISLLAMMSTVLGMTIIGLLDDVLGWKEGLKQWQKPLLTLPIALPMMAINAGHSVLVLPLLGAVNFGVLYPLLIIPIGIIGAANGFNMLAGLNGLEAGMGALILGTLGIFAWSKGTSWITMLAFCMVFALLAFLFYNWTPARIFPGDTLTYTVGALIACIAILGNMERAALVAFTLYFIELLIKARGGFKGECFGVPQKDGTLAPPDGRRDSLTHLVMGVKRLREWQVVLIILCMQFVVGISTLLLYR